MVGTAWHAMAWHGEHGVAEGHAGCAGPDGGTVEGVGMNGG